MRSTEEKPAGWTTKQIIKGKTLPFLMMTILFTTLFIKLSDYGLTAWLNKDNTGVMIHNYSLGVFGLVMIIPAVILSIGILKAVMNKKARVAGDSFEPTEGEVKFKWNLVCAPSSRQLKKYKVFVLPGNTGQHFYDAISMS